MDFYTTGKSYDKAADKILADKDMSVDGLNQIATDAGISNEVNWKAPIKEIRLQMLQLLRNKGDG